MKAKSTTLGKDSVKNRPRVFLSLLLDKRLCLNVYCFHLKSSSGGKAAEAQLRSIQDRNEAELSTTTSATPQGQRKKNAGKKKKNAVEAGASSAGTSDSGQGDEEEDMEPEVEENFKFEDWCTPAKDHKRIVSMITGT
jgi:hypothetical protein